MVRLSSQPTTYLYSALLLLTCWQVIYWVYIPPMWLYKNKTHCLKKTDYIYTCKHPEILILRHVTTFLWARRKVCRNPNEGQIFKAPSLFEKNSALFFTSKIFLRWVYFSISMFKVHIYSFVLNVIFYGVYGLVWKNVNFVSITADDGKGDSPKSWGDGTWKVVGVPGTSVFDPFTSRGDLSRHKVVSKFPPRVGKSSYPAKIVLEI